MALETLLLSVDAAATRTIRRILQDMGISLVEASSTSAAADLLARRKFDALIGDCDGLPGVEDLLQRLRHGASNRSVIVFALINGATSVRRAYSLGANFVFEKPLDVDRASRSFRAALGLMARERRRYYRVEVALAVTCDFGNGSPQKVTATNLSETGLAVRAAHKLTEGAPVRLTFNLPNGTPMDCRAEVAWSTDDGRAGLRLLVLSEPARRQLTTFVATAVNAEECLPPSTTSGYAGAKHF
jgi:DNA-binding response OmpR family regulator